LVFRCAGGDTTSCEKEVLKKEKEEAKVPFRWGLYFFRRDFYRCPKAGRAGCRSGEQMPSLRIYPEAPAGKGKPKKIMNIIKLQCPKCGEFELTRTHRMGFMQRFIYPKLGLFPWECSQCRRISMLTSRSGRSILARSAAAGRTVTMPDRCALAPAEIRNGAVRNRGREGSASSLAAS
jgi:hypothetical protein